MHHIKIVGDVDEDCFSNFMSDLADSTTKHIDISLYSHGGISFGALALYDYIQELKKMGYAFNITGYGLVASAATLILAAGDKRYMTKNSWLMVHEDSLEASGAHKHEMIHQVEKKIAVMRKLEEQWNLILEQATGTTVEVWKHLHQNETYLTAQEALELNIIQEVL
jgi:ATP-dependent protease ClpP protease subunit